LDYDVGRFLRILLDEEVKDLEKSENRLEQARLAYDAVVTDVQQARKKDHKGAKSEAFDEKELQARKKFENVGQEMVDEMAVRHPCFLLSFLTSILTQFRFSIRTLTLSLNVR
jgi:hypothetical protein